MSKSSKCRRCGAEAQDEICMECAFRESEANKPMAAGSRADGATGAGYLIDKFEDIRKREAVEAAELLADAIERKREANASNEPMAAASEAVNAEAEQSQEWAFYPTGDGYFISGFGESGHLKKIKGLDDIYRLIQTPSVPVPMLDLVGADERLKTDKRSRQETLDGEAKMNIHDELCELKADLEKAEKDKNTVEADSTRQQIEALEDQVKAAVGIHGNDRDMNNRFDKLRSKIHNRIAHARRKMLNANPPMPQLAKHFEETIGAENSHFFIYRPAINPDWKIQKNN